MKKVLKSKSLDKKGWAIITTTGELADIEDGELWLIAKSKKKANLYKGKGEKIIRCKIIDD